MKIFTYILLIIGVGLIVLNATKLDFSDLLKGDSAVAVIGILAAACAILLALILRTSVKIKQRKK
ncbi:hypothetical protein POV27_18025 [Aureisphaera galaxeae]|uniref:hypothetical protein n=1 Tax=Aureisphaera galaxeae TaxID=1538023 RepID=UPI00235022D4|nr:hypothetical protein [Aureisphaera galaxeae]MDC8005956.1 hypothetical protein [Aureisphaera galaxeae]